MFASAFGDGAVGSSVGAAHKALADFASGVPGVRVCRYGLNAEERSSTVYAVYDSPAALQDLFDALVARGGDVMAAESALTELVPAQTYVQGSKQALDAVGKVIDGWGLRRFHTDTQGSSHLAL